MVEKTEALLTVQALTERALQMLDDMGVIGPAVHLQMALDLMTNAPIPRTEEEAEAMLHTKEARALLVKLASMPPAAKAPERWSGAFPPDAVDRAAALVRLHADKALGRARMHLYQALQQDDPDQVHRLSAVCAVLMQAGYA